jgi:PAS domain S-box-containing protein
MVTVDLARTSLAPRTLRAVPTDELGVPAANPALLKSDPEIASNLAGVAQRLQRLLDASPDPIFIIDTRFRCLYGNVTAAGLLHRTPEEMPGSRFTDYFHPEDVAALSAALNALGDEGQAKVSARTQDELGVTRDLEVYLNDLGDRTIQAVVHDVTSWVSQERALRATSDRHRQWLTLAAEPLMVVSMDLQISYANEALGGLVGLGRDEIMSLALVDLVHPDDRAAMATRLIRPPGGDQVLATLRLIHRDGRPISLWVRISSFDGSEAILRFHPAGGANNDENLSTIMEYRDLQVDFIRRRVVRDNSSISLTPTEFDVLAELARNRGSVLTPVELLASIWGPECTDDLHLLRTAIWRLRRKLEVDSRAPQYVVTVAGGGYTFGVDD